MGDHSNVGRVRRGAGDGRSSLSPLGRVGAVLLSALATLIACTGPVATAGLCLADTDCPSGGRCGPNLQCLSGSEAGAACAGDADCPTATPVCNLALGQCEGAAGTAGTNPGTGTVCTAAGCTFGQGCVTGADCGVGSTCIAGACAAGTAGTAATGGCFATTDCAAGQVCVGGVCTAQAGTAQAGGGAVACRIDAECLTSQFCDRHSLACVELATVVCTTDAACPMGSGCVSGRCAAR